MFKKSVGDFNIPLKTLQKQNGNKRLVAGVAIIATDKHSGIRKLLVLQRTDDEQEYPSMFEIPGGGAEDNQDTSILDTVRRETWEETGLEVSRVLGSFDGFEYETKKGKALQFNFLAEVKGELEDVVLNPGEHQRYAWIGCEDDISQYEMTGSMAKVVCDALDIIRYDL